LEGLSAQIAAGPQASTTVEKVKLPTNVRVDSLCCCRHVKTQHRQYRTRQSGHTYGWGRCAKCLCTKFSTHRAKAALGV
jgi:hypothetical protein